MQANTTVSFLALERCVFNSCAVRKFTKAIHNNEHHYIFQSQHLRIFGCLSTAGCAGVLYRWTCFGQAWLGKSRVGRRVSFYSVAFRAADFFQRRFSFDVDEFSLEVTLSGDTIHVGTLKAQFGGETFTIEDE